MPIPPNYVALSGSERTPMQAARVVAEADPAERLQVTVLVRPKKPLAVSAATVNYEGLPHERHHMTPEEFREAHGASAGDLTAVEEFARSQNLQVSEVNDVQRSVKLTGTVADFTKAFGVELQQYEYSGGTYRGRTGPIHIPKSLEGIVEGVFGLDNRPAAEPHCGLGSAKAVKSAGVGESAGRGSSRWLGERSRRRNWRSSTTFPRTGTGRARPSRSSNSAVVSTTLIYRRISKGSG